MRYLVITLFAVMLLVPTLAMADNFFDDMTDILKGRNEDIPLSLYLAKTVELEKIPVINILNADLRFKISTPYGDEFFERGMLEVGLEF